MLTVVLAFLLVVIAFLAIPVTLSFAVSWRQVLQKELELKWAFGLVRVRIPFDQAKVPEPDGEETKRRIARPRRSSRKKQNLFAAVRQRRFRRRVIRFVGDLWRTVHKEDVTLCLRVGLGDPADTGQLWAFFGPAAGMLASVQQASIKIEPDFLDTTFELDSSGSIRIIPLQMIYLAVALLLSPTIWQGLKQMRATGG